MKFILLALFAVASAVPVPDDDVKFYLPDNPIYDSRLAPVVLKPEKVELKSVKISDLSDDDVYLTVSEPKRYVEVKKPVVKAPVYKEIVYKKPVLKAPVVEYKLKDTKVVTPKLRAVPAVKTYSAPLVYYDD